MKKLLAFLILHLYVVSVFGITIGMHSCCTGEKEILSCEFHHKTPDCGHHDTPGNNEEPLPICWEDCDVLRVDIAHDQPSESVHLNNSASADPIGFSPLMTVRLCIAPAIPPLLQLTSAEWDTGPIIVEDTPIFIQNCTYRL